jgi:hypothetical protein
MKNLSMFCLCLYPEHLNNLKKMNYIPVGLGINNFNNEWLRDNIGPNISNKNKYYGEYTFHYWFWKNMIDNISDKYWIGFCAYRRYWVNNNNNNIKSGDLEKIINNNNFKEYVLQNSKPEWSDFETILPKSEVFGKFKISKIIKNGGVKSIVKNFKSFITNKTTIKFHFDVFHGNGNLDKAIDLLEKNERDDFRVFIEGYSFSKENMFICKSKKIIKEYYKSVFPWLEKCESIFGFNLNSWREVRIYGFLAERYLSYWFNKYTAVKEWPIFFYDTNKNNLNL